jgi:hypothetical protein
MAYSVDELLLLLRPHDPLKVSALQQNRRRVEYGLTTTGLKLHCMEEGASIRKLIEALGGRAEALAAKPYRYEKAAVTFVLPAFGNVRSAILFVECLESYLGFPIFNNKRFQIQVCSPCRLIPEHASILSAAFYLGSDLLRRYTLEDMGTTFSANPDFPSMRRGRRIALYDGLGRLDRSFCWWNLEGSKLKVHPELPFTNERTDILTCQTKIDMHNVNLLATLLSHHQELGYWEHLGARFVRDFRALLSEHMMDGVLDVAWIHPGDGTQEEDDAFFRVYKELEHYVFSEYDRMNKHRLTWWSRQPATCPGILIQTRELLDTYRRELVGEAEDIYNKSASKKLSDGRTP